MTVDPVPRPDTRAPGVKLLIAVLLAAILTIPLFAGVIGYVTNWSGIWMLFNPIRFWGFRVPGLGAINQVLPRKVQQIPGVMHGGLGWQGIIPSRSAKMGSIAVDKGIAKLGSAADFYEQLEPEKIAEAISYGVVKMNIDTDLQWALWDGIRTYASEHRDYLQSQIGNPDGPDKPNKKQYDPRVWLRAGEESFVSRLEQAFAELNNVGTLS